MENGPFPIYSPSFPHYGSADSLFSIPELNVDEESALNRYVTLLQQQTNAVGNGLGYHHSNEPTVPRGSLTNLTDLGFPAIQPFQMECKVERASPISYSTPGSLDFHQPTGVNTSVQWPVQHADAARYSSLYYPSTNYWQPALEQPTAPVYQLPFNYGATSMLPQDYQYSMGNNGNYYYTGQGSQLMYHQPVHQQHFFTQEEFQHHQEETRNALDASHQISEQIYERADPAIRSDLYPVKMEPHYPADDDEPINLSYPRDQFKESYSPLRDIGQELPTRKEDINSNLLVSYVDVQPERKDFDPKLPKDLLGSHVSAQPNRNDLDPNMQNDLLVNYVGPFRNDLQRAKAKNRASGHQIELTNPRPEMTQKEQINEVTILQPPILQSQPRPPCIPIDDRCGPPSQGVKPHQCTTCGSRFSRRFHLIRHTKQRGCQGTPRTVFFCVFCKKSFTRKDNLQEHLKCHTGQVKVRPRLPCTFPGCKKLLQGRTQLQIHLNLHTGSRPFTCTREGCTKAFSSNAALKKHLRVHNNYLPFQCPQCDMRFVFKEVLMNHMKEHGLSVAIKSCICRKCGMAFVQQQALDQHLLQHHHKTVYECNFCRRTYKMMWRMEQHMKQDHPNEKLDGVPRILRGYSGLESQQLARNVSTQHGPREPPQAVETGIVDPELLSEDNQIQAGQVPVNFETDLVKLEEVDIDYGDEKQENDLNGNHCAYNDYDDEDTSATDTISCGTPRVDLDSSITESAPSCYDENFEEKPPPPPTPAPSEDEVKLRLLQVNIMELLNLLMDPPTLYNFGWPDVSVDSVLQAVVIQCGKEPLTDHTVMVSKRLTENVQKLFSFIVDDQDALETILLHKPVEEVLQHVIDLAKSA